MAFRERIKFFWDGLSPKAKQRVVLFSVIGAIVVVSAAGYWVRSSAPPPPRQAGGKREDVALDPKLLEKSMYMEGQKEIAKRDEKIAQLSKQIDDIVNDKKDKDDQVKSIQDEKKVLTGSAEPGNVRNAGKGAARLPDLPIPPPPGASASGSRSSQMPIVPYARVPLPPGQSGVAQQGAGQPYQSNPAAAVKPDTFGEIEVVSARDATKGKDGKDDGTDKKKSPATTSICRLLSWRRPFFPGWMPLPLTPPRVTRRRSSSASRTWRSSPTG
jgi:conjugal transfer pilus assembly protein TraB